MMKKLNALVLISGGIDSTVVLHWALDKGIDCKCLTFRYKNQPKKEIEAINKLCSKNKLDLFIIEHPSIYEFGRSNKNLEINPNNLMYYSLAVSFSVGKNIDLIIGGQNKEDLIESKENIKHFYKKLNSLIIDCNSGQNLKIIQPFINFSKLEVVNLGIKLKVSFKDCWSCQRDGSKPCGKCSNCKTNLNISKKLKISI